MIDFTSRFGRRLNRRLRQEKIIWLTTVDSHNRPQPRPVWFHWDGQSVLIFSRRNTAKLRHIPQNTGVALNFNTDEEGDNVGVLIGEARLLLEPPSSARLNAYLRKYKEGIKDLDMTVPQFTASFAVPILVAPRAMRGY
ncbi:MAG: TIGR03667 family PPOX class F420-dependent oxidoreductase [bacterium]